MGIREQQSGGGIRVGSGNRSESQKVGTGVGIREEGQHRELKGACALFLKVFIISLLVLFDF